MHGPLNVKIIVGIVTGLWTGLPPDRVSIPRRTKRVCCLWKRPDRLRCPLILLCSGYRCFPWELKVSSLTLTNKPTYCEAVTPLPHHAFTVHTGINLNLPFLRKVFSSHLLAAFRSGIFPSPCLPAAWIRTELCGRITRSATYRSAKVKHHTL